MVAQVPTQKPGNLFQLTKWVKTTCGRVIFPVKMLLVDLYLKLYSFAGISQTFC